MSSDSKGMHISRVWGQKPVGFEQLTIDATVGGITLTPTNYESAKGAVITIETADLRFRVDGGSPSSTLGHLAQDDDEITLRTLDEIINFKAIRTGTVSAVINVTYFD